MTYLNVVGDEDEYLTLWTGGANYAGTMDPGKFHIGVHGAGNTEVVGTARKYLDKRMSDEHGIPIYRPLISGPRRNTVPTGYVFGGAGRSVAQVGVFTVNGKSPDSRSERNASNVGSGGTTPGITSGGRTIKPTKFINSRGETRHSCPRGYELQRIGKRFMCVKR